MTVKKLKIINKQRKGVNACDLSPISSRLHKINGQVTAVERMIENKRDCVEVLQQIIAARKALDRVGILILESEVRGCLSNQGNEKKLKGLQKAVNVLFRTV